MGTWGNLKIVLCLLLILATSSCRLSSDNNVRPTQEPEEIVGFGFAEEIAKETYALCDGDEGSPLTFTSSTTKTANSPFRLDLPDPAEIPILTYMGVETMGKTGSVSCGVGRDEFSFLFSSGQTAAITRGCSAMAMNLSPSLQGCNALRGPTYLGRYMYTSTTNQPALVPDSPRGKYDFCYLTYTGWSNPIQGMVSCRVEQEGDDWLIKATGTAGITRACQATCLSFPTKPSGEVIVPPSYHSLGVHQETFSEPIEGEHDLCVLNEMSFHNVSGGSASCYVNHQAGKSFRMGTTGTTGRMSRSCGAICTSFSY